MIAFDLKSVLNFCNVYDKHKCKQINMLHLQHFLQVVLTFVYCSDSVFRILSRFYQAVNASGTEKRKHDTISRRWLWLESNSKSSAGGVNDIGLQ